MNARTNIARALQGKSSPVANLAWRVVCPSCGRDGYCGGYPKTAQCVECGEQVEYQENPEYDRPSMLTLAKAE